jgi:hypothetical protein
MILKVAFTVYTVHYARFFKDFKSRGSWKVANIDYIQYDKKASTRNPLNILYIYCTAWHFNLSSDIYKPFIDLQSRIG